METLVLTPGDGTFTVTASDRNGDGLADAINLAYVDHIGFTGHWWFLELNTDQLGQNLLPRLYQDAERAGFASPGHPGLDLFGDGRGSNQVFGEFWVYEAVFDYSSGALVVQRFAAEIELHSEDAEAPASFATFNYNYSAGFVLPESIVELENEGNDTVKSAFDHTLGANLENLVLTGDAAVSGTGNALDNALTGNGANNVLRGGLGSDRLTGGAGSDTFDYDAIAEGQDTVADFVKGAGGDVLDVSDVLAGYAAGTSRVADFVRLTQNGQHTRFDVNADGAGCDFVTLAILENVTATAGLLNELVAQGNLVLA